MLVEDFMLKSKYEINTKILESNEKYLNEGRLKKEEIEEEIGDYSLTPKKSLVRKFFSFEAEPKSIKETKPFISKEIDEELKSFTMTKGLPKKTIMDRLELLLNDNFFIKSKEEVYSNNYSKIAQSYNLKAKDPFIFYDECEEIIRFGINIHNTKNMARSFNDILIGIIKINENNIYPLENNLKNVNEKNSKPKSNKSNDQAILNYDNFKILHPLETLLFKEAVGFMLAKKTKSILIDIFERDKKDGSIEIEKDKSKTHTVILCREDFNNSNFLIIDPSNSEFSKHFGLLGVNNILSMELEKEINIFVSPVNYKIYEQNKEIGTGYAFNKFRDCVDIAFKLAKKFNLLKDQKISFNINEKENNVFNEKEANLIVKAITNNIDYDDGIDKALCETKFLKYPLRGKQLNDEKLGQKLYEQENKVFKVLNEKVKNLKLSILPKTQAIEEMNYILNNIKDTSQTKDFLKKVEKAYNLMNGADDLFITQPNNQNNDISQLGDILESLNEGFDSYYQ